MHYTKYMHDNEHMRDNEYSDLLPTESDQSHINITVIFGIIILVLAIATPFLPNDPNIETFERTHNLTTCTIDVHREVDNSGYLLPGQPLDCTTYRTYQTISPAENFTYILSASFMNGTKEYPFTVECYWDGKNIPEIFYPVSYISWIWCGLLVLAGTSITSAWAVHWGISF